MVHRLAFGEFTTLLSSLKVYFQSLPSRPLLEEAVCAHSIHTHTPYRYLLEYSLFPVKIVFPSSIHKHLRCCGEVKTHANATPITTNKTPKMKKARTSNDINGSANHHHLTTELSKHSVLMGRGSGPNEHYGNRYFRTIVAEKQLRYHSVDTSPLERTHIISSIINEVHSLGGLFLRKLSKSEARRLPKNLAGIQIRSTQNKNSRGSGAGSGRASTISNPVYSEVDDVTVVEKIKQALRYAQGVKDNPADDNRSDEGGPGLVMSNGNIDGITARGGQIQSDRQDSAPPRKKIRLASESTNYGGASNGLAAQQGEGQGAPTSAAGPLGYVERTRGTSGGGKQQEREHQGLQQQRDLMNQHYHIPPAPPPALAPPMLAGNASSLHDVILGISAAATPIALVAIPPFQFPLQVAAAPPPAAATAAHLGPASLLGYPLALGNSVVPDPVLSILQSLFSSGAPQGTSPPELMMLLANRPQNVGGAAVPAPVPTITTTPAAAEDATQRLLALLQASTTGVGNPDDSRRGS